LIGLNRHRGCRGQALEDAPGFHPVPNSGRRQIGFALPKIATQLEIGFVLPEPAPFREEVL
jgi:hypothetical protein